MKADGIIGVVLAGGESLRMGRDKGLINFHGIPQRQYLFNELSKVCDGVITSCREAQNIPRSLNPVFDRQSSIGPLTGIVSSLEAYPGFALLIGAVDIPEANANLFRHLLIHRDPQKLATCYRDLASGMPEPLMSIWEPAARTVLVEWMRSGNVSPRRFLETHEVRMIETSKESSLSNLNTEEELLIWQASNMAAMG
jgi:molybdopterin-guanine dinucleotide biosynthesis protein A